MGKQKIIKRVVVEWSVSPKDLLRDEIVLHWKPWTVRIGPGAVVADCSNAPFPDASEIGSIEARVVSAIQVLQTRLHRPARLGGYSFRREYEDNSADINLQAASLVLEVSVGPADIVVKDANGNVLSDSRAERTEALTHAAYLGMVHAEHEVAQRLLESFSVAVGHPARVAAHLFEIVELVRRHFGGQRESRHALGIEAADAMDYLGKLANDEPIVEGRHLGKHAHELRPMSVNELNRALQSASVIIVAFLSTLS